MGYIKEPKGVDFLIKSEPLTEGERVAISAFIATYKAKKVTTSKRVAASRKTKKQLA